MSDFLGESLFFSEGFFSQGREVAIGTMVMMKGEDFIWELAHKEKLHPSASGTAIPPLALELFYGNFYKLLSYDFGTCVE